jgi:hypothetical protein
MGAEVILKIPKKRVKAMKNLIARLFEKAEGENYHISLGPAVTNWEKKYNKQPDCWIQWNRTQLEFGYTFGGDNGQWAKALALEFCKICRPEAAGWDSIGYVDDLDKFLSSYPFKTDIELKQEAIKRGDLDSDLQKVFKKEIKEHRIKAKAFAKAAAKIFAVDK